MEVESSEEGTLTQIVVEAGLTVPVGTVLAYLDQGGEEAVAALATAEVRVATPTPKEALKKKEISIASSNSPLSAPTSPAAERPRATPRARKLARELKIDVTGIHGSGSKGRIIEEDIRKAAVSSHHQTTPPATGLRHRSIIAERMTRSVQTIPHFSLVLEVEATQLIALRDNLKKEVEKATGSKLTLTDLFLKAIGIAMAETPEFNAVWEEGVVRARNSVDIGLAVATVRGVVAPVIRNVDRIELAEIASSRCALIKKAAKGALSLNEIEGGVGILSNLGMYRVDWFQAIIDPAQSFVLAVGKVTTRPWIDAALVVVRPTVVLNLSVDHRVVDGAMAAQFLGKLAEIIERPFRLLWKPSHGGGLT